MKKISCLIAIFICFCLCFTGCASSKSSYPFLGDWLLFDQESEEGFSVSVVLELAEDSTYTVYIAIDYMDSFFEEYGNIPRETLEQMFYSMTDITLGELNPLAKGKYSYKDSVITFKESKLEKIRFADILSVICGENFNSWLHWSILDLEMIYDIEEDTLIENENVYFRYE